MCSISLTHWHAAFGAFFSSSFIFLPFFFPRLLEKPLTSPHSSQSPWSLPWGPRCFLIKSATLPGRIWPQLYGWRLKCHNLKNARGEKKSPLGTNLCPSMYALYLSFISSYVFREPLPWTLTVSQRTDASEGNVGTVEDCNRWHQPSLTTWWRHHPKPFTHSKGHFQVLSPPDIHPWIIASYFFKVCFVYRE